MVPDHRACAEKKIECRARKPQGSPPLTRKQLMPRYLVLVRGSFHGHIAVFIHWGFLITFLLTRSLHSLSLAIGIGRGSLRERTGWTTEDRLLQVGRDWGWPSSNSDKGAAKLSNDMGWAFGIDDFLDNELVRGFAMIAGQDTHHLFPEKVKSLQRP
jgi:hypothetical protein